MVRKLAAVAALLVLSGCATAQRHAAAGDIHALLVAIRDDDRATFERHVDRAALKRQLEARLVGEVEDARAPGGLRGLGLQLSGPLADLAGDLLIQPRAFRAAAEHYGYEPGSAIPPAIVIGRALRSTGPDEVCATAEKDGPCLLTFTRQAGTWRLSGFEGDLRP